MLSFWESESLLKYDYIIIGSGIVGLQSAIRLKNLHPNATVLILERGILPTGASTRNAGFACFGSLSELVDDIEVMGQEKMVHLFQQRMKGIQLLREQLGDEAIGYESNGSHELLEVHEEYLLDYIDKLNSILPHPNGTEVFTLYDDMIGKFGLNRKKFTHCISANLEGSVHTGRLMRSLMGIATIIGVQIICGASVTNWEKYPTHVEVHVDDPIRMDSISFKADTILFCTNAFSGRFFPELDINPGRGQVIITHPIPDLKIKGIFHFDHGYYYFRSIENRILFGGGRNIDFEGENTTELGSNETIISQLIRHLKEDIIPDQPFEIDKQWSGIMAFGNDKNPIIHQHSDRVYGAFRLGGMGVALGSQVANELISMVESNN